MDQNQENEPRVQTKRGKLLQEWQEKISMNEKRKNQLSCEFKRKKWGHQESFSWSRLSHQQVIFFFSVLSFLSWFSLFFALSWTSQETSCYEFSSFLSRLLGSKDGLEGEFVVIVAGYLFPSQVFVSVVHLSLSHTQCSFCLFFFLLMMPVSCYLRWTWCISSLNLLPRLSPSRLSF